jgi:hypothetical protein
MFAGNRPCKCSSSRARPHAPAAQRPPACCCWRKGPRPPVATAQSLTTTDTGNVACRHHTSTKGQCIKATPRRAGRPAAATAACAPPPHHPASSLLLQSLCNSSSWPTNVHPAITLQRLGWRPPGPAVGRGDSNKHGQTQPQRQVACSACCTSTAAASCFSAAHRRCPAASSAPCHQLRRRQCGGCLSSQPPSRQHPSAPPQGW